MSNLYKRGTTISKDERVIDYNELIQSKLQQAMESRAGKVDPDGFVNGLQADVVEELVLDEEEVSPEEIARREEAATIQASEIIEDAKSQAESIIANATEEANNVLTNAQSEAERIREESKEAGYQEGIDAAGQIVDQKIAELEMEYNQKTQALEQEYNQMKAQIEPELVNVITDVFRKVTKTVSEDNEEIILHLINDVLKNAEGAREFTIKVSSEDYKFLINNQGKIYCAMSKDVNIDIIEDQTAEKGQCIVETNTGVFNCGIDIELENLIREIKLLSCI